MAKGTGVITLEIESTYRVPSKAAPGYAAEQDLEGKKRKRTKRPIVSVPAPKPINVGDSVISRDYFSGGIYRKLFAGTATVRTISTENRRDLGSGKPYTVHRMTVIADGRRFDVLEAMLQFAGSPVAPVVEPVKVVPEPDPAPRAIMHPLPMAVMVVNVKRGKAVNTNTPAVIALYAHEADMRRAEVRLRHEQETGEAAPKPAPMDVGRPKFWMRNPDGTMEKREVVS